MTDVPPEEGSAPGTSPDTDHGQDDEIDEASEESFPASDAPERWSGPPGA